MDFQNVWLFSLWKDFLFSAISIDYIAALAAQEQSDPSEPQTDTGEELYDIEL